MADTSRCPPLISTHQVEIFGEKLLEVSFYAPAPPLSLLIAASSTSPLITTCTSSTTSKSSSNHSKAERGERSRRRHHAPPPPPLPDELLDIQRRWSNNVEDDLDFVLVELQIERDVNAHLSLTTSFATGHGDPSSPTASSPPPPIARGVASVDYNFLMADAEDAESAANNLLRFPPRRLSCTMAQRAQELLRWITHRYQHALVSRLHDDLHRWCPSLEVELDGLQRSPAPTLRSLPHKPAPPTSSTNNREKTNHNVGPIVSGFVRRHREGAKSDRVGASVRAVALFTIPLRLFQEEQRRGEESCASIINFVLHTYARATAAVTLGKAPHTSKAPPIASINLALRPCFLIKYNREAILRREHIHVSISGSGGQTFPEGSPYITFINSFIQWPNYRRNIMIRADGRSHSRADVHLQEPNPASSPHAATTFVQDHVPRLERRLERRFRESAHFMALVESLMAYFGAPISLSAAAQNWSTTADKVQPPRLPTISATNTNGATTSAAVTTSASAGEFTAVGAPRVVSFAVVDAPTNRSFVVVMRYTRPVDLPTVSVISSQGCDSKQDAVLRVKVQFSASMLSSLPKVRFAECYPWTEVGVATGGPATTPSSSSSTAQSVGGGDDQYLKVDALCATVYERSLESLAYLLNLSPK